MMVEAPLIGAISGLLVAALAWLGFWMKFSDRITRAESTAKAALQTAAESAESAKEAHERSTTLAAAFGLYREQAVEKFVTYTVIAEIEKRLVESQAKGEQRLADAIEGMNKRLDRLIEAGLRTSHSP